MTGTLLQETAMAQEIFYRSQILRRVGSMKYERVAEVVTVLACLTVTMGLMFFFGWIGNLLATIFGV